MVPTMFHRLLALEMGLIEHLDQRSAIQITMQQYRTYDVDTLSHLVLRCGFRVVESGTFFIKPFTHAQMALLQSVGVISQSVLNGLYLIGRHFPDNGSELFMNVRLTA